jgi:protein-S-isoprenylcysteine O-methyltransferase Ste14
MIPSMGNESKSRKTFWASVAFYFLIGFEFLYMASPFAIYFYAVYRPVLNFLNESQVGWLTRYFMPHIADTSSSIINLHNTVGGSIALLGFIGFLVGAIQVYYHKLAKKGAVLGGIYRIIRHPQYASFAICGLGLLIVWPRYIVLVTYITMLFIYYTLAKIEEAECEDKFGQSYIDYKRTTNMFLPFRIPLTKSFSSSFNELSRWSKFAVMFVMYLVAMYASIESIELVEAGSINSLYKYSTSNSVTVSVTRMSSDNIKTVIDTAISNKEVQ